MGFTQRLPIRCTSLGDKIGLQARNILTSLFTRDPHEKSGVNVAVEIKRYPLFARNINFRKLLLNEIQPYFMRAPSYVSSSGRHPYVGLNVLTLAGSSSGESGTGGGGRHSEDMGEMWVVVEGP